MEKLLLILSIVSGPLLWACTPKDNTKIVTFEGKSFEQKWAFKDLNPDL